MDLFTALPQHEYMSWINAAKRPLFPCYLSKRQTCRLEVTFHRCPTCIYFVSVIRPKGLWVQQSAKAGTEEGEGEEETTQTILRECRKQKKRQRVWVTVWQSSNFSVQSVVSSCSIGVENQTQRTENECTMASLKWLMKITSLFGMLETKVGNISPAELNNFVC